MYILKYLSGVLYLIIGVLIIFLAIPLLKNKIKTNPYYGFRFGKASNNDNDWYVLNNYAAKQLIIWSSVLIVWAFVEILFLGERSDYWYFVEIVTPIFVYSIAMLNIYFYSKRL